jgi:hypothetical protein
MSQLRKAVRDYLTMRRSLGFKPGREGSPHAGARCAPAKGAGTHPAADSPHKRAAAPLCIPRPDEPIPGEWHDVSAEMANKYRQSIRQEKRLHKILNTPFKLTNTKPRCLILCLFSRNDVVRISRSRWLWRGQHETRISARMNGQHASASCEDSLATGARRIRRLRFRQSVCRHIGRSAPGRISFPRLYLPTPIRRNSVGCEQILPHRLPVVTCQFADCLDAQTLAFQSFHFLHVLPP